MSVKYSTLSALLVSVLVTGPVNSADADVSQPASLKVMGGAHHELNWMGKGDIRRVTPICIRTPTGRFSLRVSSISGGGLRGAGELPYSISLNSQASLDGGRLTSAQPTIQLMGQVAANADCSHGPNAELVIGLTRSDLLTGTAGEYFDQLRISVETR